MPHDHTSHPQAGCASTRFLVATAGLKTTRSTYSDTACNLSSPCQSLSSIFSSSRSSLSVYRPYLLSLTFSSVALSLSYFLFLSRPCFRSLSQPLSSSTSHTVSYFLLLSLVLLPLSLSLSFSLHPSLPLSLSISFSLTLSSLGGVVARPSEAVSTIPRGGSAHWDRRFSYCPLRYWS